MNYKHISSNGQFASKRAGKNYRWVVYLIILSLGGFVAWGQIDRITGETYKKVEKISSSVASAVVSTAKAERTPDRLDFAIEKMKSEVVKKLKDGESRGLVFKEGDMSATFDPSPSMKSACTKIGGVQPKDCNSYGWYQLKISTVQMWQKQLGDPVMSDMEVIKLSFDEKASTEFVTRVIFQLQGSLRNWSYAVNNWTEFNEKVSTIRTLEAIN